MKVMKLFFLATALSFVNLNHGINPESSYMEVNNTCQMCESLVKIIDYDLKKDNKTVQDILKFVENICDHIIGPSSKECLIIVKNIENIVNWINKGVDPHEICLKLHFCNNSHNNSHNNRGSVNIINHQRCNNIG